jgi:hypothetical protein
LHGRQHEPGKAGKTGFLNRLLKKFVKMFERSDFFVGAITAARPSHLLSGKLQMAS